MKKELTNFQFTFEKMTTCIKSLKTYLSPGHDQSPTEIFKQLSMVLIRIFNKVYKEALKSRKPVCKLIAIAIAILFEEGNKMHIPKMDQ